jgi:LmbE family N-acetylglucosaminyl deacetylase
MTTTTFDERALPATAPLATRTRGTDPERPNPPRSGQREHARHQDVAGLGTTVAVWAHPDDETYLAGGLLAALRDAGQRVLCVTATRGDAGNGLHDGGSAAARSALGDLRASELEAALDVLGIGEHRWLDYVDGECATVDVDEAAERLVNLFDEVQPQTVVSFGPDGYTGHPDHRAVAQWTQRAVERWHPRPLLLQAASTEEDREAARDIDERFVAHGWAFPPSVRLADLTIRVVLKATELDRKVEALGQQFSQTARLIKDVGERRFASWVSAEAFCSA